MTVVSLRPRAIEGLKTAPKKYQLRLDEALCVLRQGLFPPHTKKLGGKSYGHRTRVGRWRILFVLKNDEVDVADIFLKKGRSDYRRGDI
jgi:mRNA-degrading endonuclease RelE of RelBE toxin-antitoxin system